MKKLISLVVIAVVILGISVLAYERNIDGSLSKNGRLTPTSKDQLMRDFILSPTIVAAYVVKARFKEDESPLIWFETDNDKFLKVMKQHIGTGSEKEKGSDYYTSRLRDPELIAKVASGEIACDAIEKTALPIVLPSIVEFAKTACFIPLPTTGNGETKVLITVLMTIPPTGIDINTFREQAKKVQIDIYNREYLGIETWSELSKRD